MSEVDWWRVALLAGVGALGLLATWQRHWWLAVSMLALTAVIGRELWHDLTGDTTDR